MRSSPAQRSPKPDSTPPPSGPPGSTRSTRECSAPVSTTPDKISRTSTSGIATCQEPISPVRTSAVPTCIPYPCATPTSPMPTSQARNCNKQIFKAPATPPQLSGPLDLIRSQPGPSWSQTSLPQASPSPHRTSLRTLPSAPPSVLFPPQTSMRVTRSLTPLSVALDPPTTPRSPSSAISSRPPPCSAAMFNTLTPFASALPIRAGSRQRAFSRSGWASTTRDRTSPARTSPGPTSQEPTSPTRTSPERTSGTRFSLAQTSLVQTSLTLNSQEPR